jgi:hypothetical protein
LVVKDSTRRCDAVTVGGDNPPNQNPFHLVAGQSVWSGALDAIERTLASVVENPESFLVGSKLVTGTSPRWSRAAFSLGAAKFSVLSRLRQFFCAGNFFSQPWQETARSVRDWPEISGGSILRRGLGTFAKVIN